MTPPSDIPRSDDGLVDEQDIAEALDPEETGAPDDDWPSGYPVDRALGVTDYGTTPAEEATPESWARRSAREVPDAGEIGSFHGDPDAVEGLTEPDERPLDGELLGEAAERPDLPSAEEASIHLSSPSIPEQDLAEPLDVGDEDDRP